MTAFSEFYSLVRPHIPFLIQPAVSRLARDVAEDFFKKTLAWREILDTTLAPGTNEQTLPMGLLGHGASVLMGISRVFMFTAGAGSYKVEPISEEGLAARMPRWRIDTGPPVYYVRMAGANLRVAPIPDQSYDAQIVMAVHPLATATEYSSIMHAEHAGAIRDGILARAYAMPKQEFSNPGLSNYYQVAYDDQVRDAKLRAASSDAPRDFGVAYGGL